MLSVEETRSQEPRDDNTLMPLPKYPGYYVSRDGRVYSDKSKKFIKCCRKNNGYLAVWFCVNGRYKHEYVHRMVWTAFRGDPGKLYINHIDFNKANNTLENLELVTAKQNCWHTINHRRQPTLKGRYLEKEILALEKTCRNTEISGRLGLSVDAVRTVLNRNFDKEYLRARTFRLRPVRERNSKGAYI